METAKKNKKEDVFKARCNGLVGGTARRKVDNSKVSASDVFKHDGPFYCSVCLSEAVVRKCSEKTDHFAHKGRLSPTISPKDQELHNRCRDEICDYLKKTFPDGNWKAERVIPADKSKGWKKDIIPDISGRFGNKNNKAIAIEVQKTAYTVNKIHDKTVEYRKRNMYVLWIVPLQTDLGTEPFRPRLYEKYLHSIYYGMTFYWTPNSSPKIIPVHYSPTKRWIDENTWFDIDYGGERTVGGYYLTYKTLKEPNYGHHCAFDEDFITHQRPVFTPANSKKEIPESYILKAKLDKWWPKDEYENLDKEKVRASKLLADYDNFDDYDEEVI